MRQVMLKKASAGSCTHCRRRLGRRIATIAQLLVPAGFRHPDSGLGVPPDEIPETFPVSMMRSRPSGQNRLHLTFGEGNGTEVAPVPASFNPRATSVRDPGRHRFAIERLRIADESEAGRRLGPVEPKHGKMLSTDGDAKQGSFTARKRQCRGERLFIDR